MDSYNSSNPSSGSMGGHSSSNTFMLAADMFPDGMAETLKPGEVIEFRIVGGVDPNGEVEVEYNTGKPDENETMSEGMHEGSMEGEEGGSWEDQARKVLNPQEPEAEA